jgi:hypothetical protein
MLGGLAVFGLGIESRVEAEETSSAEVAAQRAVWEGAGVANYAITYRTVCFCPVVAEMVVVVRDGVLISASNGDEAVATDRFDVYDVGRLFDLIEEEIARGADSVEVTFAAALGYPRTIAIDRLSMAVDDELFIEVTSFAETTIRSARLSPGWNLVGWTGDDASVSEAVGPIVDRVSSLHVWDAPSRAFRSFFPGAPSGVSTLETLRPGMGVWVFVTGSSALAWAVSDVAVERSLSLARGFNLVAWSGPSGIPAADAAASLGTALRGLYVWSAEAQQFSSFHADLPSGLSAPVTLNNGDGVWLDVAEPVGWSIPRPVGMVGGLVTLGPLCPVQRQDQPCPDAPYAATLVVVDADGNEVAVGESGADGRYRIALAAGDYTIVPQSPVGLPLPTAGPLDVTVVDGRWTSADIAFDSGIR